MGRLKALAAWKRHKPPLAEVLKALDWQKRQPQWTKDGGQYIPHPTTWLNAGSWMDEPFEVPAAPPKFGSRAYYDQPKETHTQMTRRILQEARANEIRH